jgi:hypothetical protein
MYFRFQTPSPCFFPSITTNDMVDLALESALSSLQLSDQSPFCPRQGFEHTRGSETAPFYVITQGRIPGIYTHW